ncbi:MAG: hypothetical protein KDD67_17025 [Ignavibacteriae bacterium]|nr:hypothetical protein [Ignavibacteriota bacterium]
MSLVILEEPRTFPPKMSFLVVWIITFVFGVFGMIVADAWSGAFWLWTVVALVSLRQVWVTRWVQVDSKGIRVRNIAQRGRELFWEDVSDIDEREIPVRKSKSFFVLKVQGETKYRPGKTTTITIDSDIVGFETLREIVQIGGGGLVEREEEDVENAEENL